MITLVVLQGPDKGRRFELPDAPALIGRDSRALPLGDNTVSRRHAELKPGDGGEWVLRDLGSSNGTYVNGQRVDRSVALRLGDQFRVGRTLLVFGAQPGVLRSSGSNVELADADSGMDSSIINTMPSSEDSLVLAVPEPAVAAMSNLKILYRLSAALGSSFSLQQILEVVMDLVFEHVQADRGIILLVDEKDEKVITPQVVRIRDEEAAARRPGKAPEPLRPVEEPEKIKASRTIIDHVVKSGDGVLSSNAMADPRFKKGRSVHDMGIRSCLCAPIKVRRMEARGDGRVGSDGRPSPDDIAGVIYIDSSVKNYTYSTDQLRLLTAIGLQAGLAIQNARLYQAGLEAERLAAIGETTAALSHSIKNILQALRGGADVVEMGLRNTNLDQARKGWGVVERNLDKIYNLTLNLLAYSRPREPSIQLVNPRTVINDCIELLANVANERGVMAVADVDRDVPAIPMDTDGIHQVLMNLLSNALDARKPDEPGLIRVTCQYDAREKLATIEVIDDGVGIQPSMMRHLFQLFHSTKGNRGTGLGLAVAKKIVDEHDGSIRAVSRPGEGSTFTIKLPVYALAGRRPGQHARAGGEVSGQLSQWRVESGQRKIGTRLALPLSALRSLTAASNHVVHVRRRQRRRLLGGDGGGALAPPRVLQARLDPADALVDVVGQAEDVGVARADVAVVEHPSLEPIDQARPVGGAEEDDGHGLDLAGLDEREQLEGLVERAEAAGEADHRAGVLQEHDLAGVEVAEVEADGLVRVGRLLVGQADVQADGRAAGVERALVGGLHDARAAAGDDGQASADQFPADGLGGGVERVAGRRPRAAEHRDGRADAGHRLEALDELAHDPQHAPALAGAGGRRHRRFLFRCFARVRRSAHAIAVASPSGTARGCPSRPTHAIVVCPSAHSVSPRRTS